MGHRPLKLELSGYLDALGEIGDARVNSVALGLKLDTLLPQISQPDEEDLDELVLLELGLEILIFREAHIDRDMDHAQVGVAEAGVCRDVSG